VADSFLPPAVLDMIVNAAEWVSGLEEATEPLEALSDLMAETAAASGDMAAAMGSSADGVASAVSGAAGVVTEAQGAMAESAKATADAVAASGDVIAASSEAAADTVAASMTGAADATGAYIDLTKAVQDALGGVGEASAAAADGMKTVADAQAAAADAAARVLELEQAVADATSEASDAAFQLAAASREATGAGSEYAVALDQASAATVRLLDLEGQLAGAEEAAAAASKEAAGAQAALGDATSAAGAKAAAAGDEQEAASGKAAGGLKLWGLAAVAGVAVSVKMAGDFQASMTRLVTSAGETKGNLAMVSQGILAMSSATDTSTSDLASGMYQVESAGFRGANGLTVLKAAAEGAYAENAKLSTVANAVTSVLVAYHMKASSATAVTNEMLQTVGEGKMTFDQLAGAISTVLPSAAELGISYAQVGGALATMTAMGTSAQEGTHLLAGTLASLANPTSVMVNEMAQMGISSVKVQQQLGKAGITGTIGELAETVARKMGPSGLVALNSFNQSAAAAQDAATMLQKLPPSIQGVAKAYLGGSASYNTWYAATKALPLTARTLADQFASTAGKAHGFNSELAAGVPAVQTFNGAMSKMLGGQSGMNTALMLTGKHAKTFNDNVAGIAGTAKTAGSDINNWALVQKNFNFQLGSAEKAVMAMATSFGAALLPAATRVMKILAELGGWLAKHTAASKALAAVVGVLLAGALEHGLAKALGTCVKGFKDVLGVSGNVIGFFRKGEGDASQFSKVLSGIATAGKTALSGLKAAGSAVSGAFSAAGSGIGTAVTAVKNWSIWSKIASGATKIWTGIQWAFNAAMDAMPIILVVLAIAALVAGIIYAYVHFRAFRDIVNDVGRAIRTGFLVALHAVERAVDEVVGFVKSHWPLLVGIILGPVAIIAALVYTHWNTVKRTFDEALGFIKNLVSRDMGEVRHLFDEALGFIRDVVSRDVNEVRKILSWFESLPGKMRGWWDEAVSAVESTVSRLLGDVRALPQRILSGLGNIGHLLWNAGTEVIHGLIGGIESMFGDLGGVAKSIGSHVLGGVKDVLGIFSPSKAFVMLGNMITAGLAIGINSTAQQAVNESRRLAEMVTGVAMAGQITASQEASLRKKLSEALAAALKGGFTDALATGTTTQIAAAAKKLTGAIADMLAGNLISSGTASSLTKWVEADTVKLQALAKQRTTIASEIAAAKSYAASTASSAVSTYDLSSAATNTAGNAQSVSGIISTLQGDVGAIRKFTANVKKLAKEGLNKGYLSQLIAMGPQLGGALAQELANANLGQIKSINSAEYQISAAAGQLGKQSADAMYDSGAQAGKGFLSGLQAQQASIEKVMAQIAASMVTRIRKDLGISSPSRVFYLHGQAVAQGLALGIASGVGQVTRAVGGLSSAASLAGIHSTVPAGVLSPASGSGGLTIHQTVQVEGKLDGEVVWRQMQQGTFRYNIRNSGQITGAVKPGMP
jgi:TP901 family phage tail tape measure protein